MGVSVRFRAAFFQTVIAAGICVPGLYVPGVAGAQVVTVPTTPVVGSSNPATAEPLVTRPSTKPCTVTLYSNEAFNDYAAHPLTYTPPSACSGPWAKVVLNLDFTVTAGRQYDRTASLYLGNANIYYGTTAEPRAALSPSWHVERDVTDLSAIFRTAQTGNAIIYNIFNSTYNGGIYGTATLQFYPANLRNLPADAPDLVVPVSGANSPYELDTTSSVLSTTVTLPRNLTKAYLDVIAQSQSGDEFWYLGVPNDVAGELETYGGTAFRETEITIDGRAAGVAPVSPWIYTGGIDPYLWEPIPGVETLNFKPYRVDLTPFAGLLSDGKPHTIGISVYNANSFFLATANLLLFRDKLRAETGGDVLENTLSAEPVPYVVTNLTTANGATTGTVTVGSKRKFTVKGYVNTGLGRVETTVEATVDFNSNQTFNVATAGVPEYQNVDQTSTVDSKTTTKLGILSEQVAKHWSFPLKLDYTFLQNTDGTYTQIVSADQQHEVSESKTLNGFPLASSETVEEVKSKDTEVYNSTLTAVLAVGPTASSSSFLSKDSTGYCWSRSLTSQQRVLTSVQDNKSCLAKY
ncbi:peptide-N4-asparagine amidase [Terriglobus saanensis]|uniref:Peptide-N(4)-(N-acetyl-beta-glucosaminyl)asparagine amidase n=1 Tax=Terriglobus saanensis (strain ATCC BAA-1853 / DSM 23119 / SP1PR4) TaxID=401053 RepID=E8UY86_TERSS|nr:peptide-N4-asparagine amidase [Terriglobus saanensis]ADV80896.1 Peptide-N(4)-(N-acetyl-beta-glucosaminyl)asparagine amidase [Terriglobus saanensis SP1PR4]